MYCFYLLPEVLPLEAAELDPELDRELELLLSVLELLLGVELDDDSTRVGDVVVLDVRPVVLDVRPELLELELLLLDDELGLV